MTTLTLEHWQTAQIDSVNKFAQFQLSYDHGFIAKAFAERGHLIEHLERKFLYFHEKYGAPAAVIMFWCELDTQNRNILVDYVLNHT